MNPELKRHGLLDEVLAEAAPAEFERGLLDGTLHAVRRRRRSRQLARGLSVLGAFAGIVLALWNALWPFNSVKSVWPALNIVSSQPLLPAMIVRTKPDNVAIVTSSTTTTTYALVETGSIQSPFQEIDDEELLALAGDRRVALVRQGPHQAELIFLDQVDKDMFPLQ
jgi:hypothetical protein